MADFKESFEILEDITTGNGAAPTKIESGDAAAGRVGLLAFVSQNKDGNLAIPCDPVSVFHDAGTVTYPTATSEVYQWRQGGVAGTVVRTLTLVYAAANKKDLVSWAWT